MCETAAVRDGRSRQWRRRALVVATLAALGLGEPSAAVLTVSTCADSGPGSLRDAVAAATDASVVDFSGLASCVISLTTGAIAVGQSTLTIDGNPRCASTAPRTMATACSRTTSSAAN